MRKLLIALVILLLPACAFADGPDGFPAELLNMTDMEFAAVCETALAGTKLSGSVVAVREDGEFALVRDEYDAFAVMFRTDGLMMLCHFIPAGGALVLDWHNDLLLSSYQDITLSMAGAAWSGGSIPRLERIFGKLYLRIDQGGWNTTDPDRQRLHAIRGLAGDGDDPVRIGGRRIVSRSAASARGLSGG